MGGPDQSATEEEEKENGDVRASLATYSWARMRDGPVQQGRKERAL